MADRQSGPAHPGSQHEFRQQKDPFGDPFPLNHNFEQIVRAIPWSDQFASASRGRSP